MQYLSTYTLCFLIALGCGCMGSLAAQPEEYRLSGFILNTEDSSSVPYAHITFANKPRFSISNEQGYFSTYVRIGDTVLISSVSYSLLSIVITEAPPAGDQTIWLRPRYYEIGKVVVYPKDIMRGFFSHRRIDYDDYQTTAFKKARVGMKLGGGQPQEGEISLLTIEGLLTTILQPLSSEYRQMKKVNEARLRRRYWRYYENLLKKKLPLVRVQRHLPLRGEELDAFFDFWQPQTLFLETASFAEIEKALEEAKERYLTHLRLLRSHRTYTQRITTLELRALLDDPLPESQAPNKALD